MSSSLDPNDLFDIPDPFAGPASASAELAAPELDALPPSPTRARTWAIRGAALLAAIACEALLVWQMGLRSGPGIGAPLVIAGVVLPALAAATTVAAAQASASPKRRVVGVVGLAALTFVLTTLATRAPGDESAGSMGRCVMGTSMMVVGPALFAIFSMRHSFVTGAAWRTAALGLGSGLIGAAATRLCCPNDAFAHVLVGHGVPIALAMLVAVAVGTRVTRA